MDLLCPRHREFWKPTPSPAAVLYSVIHSPFFHQTNAVQCVLYFFFGPESRYLRGGSGAAQSGKHYGGFRRIDPAPLTASDFLAPLAHAAHPCVALPAVAYAVEFMWTSIFVTVEIPQLFPELFGFNSQQTGLQMIAVIVGTLIGEQVGGRASDLWMARRRKRLGGRTPEPEFRLWLSYFGFALCIIGIVVFLVCSHFPLRPRGRLNL